MSDRELLLRLLGRVRRRRRLLHAMDGALVGLGAGAAVCALARRAALGWELAVPLALATLTLAALVAAARRVPLLACARAVDEAVGRRDGAAGLRNGDRTLIALSLGTAEGTLAAAAVADAARRARDLPPAQAAAWRAPRGRLPAAGLGLVALVSALVPSRPAPPGEGAPIAAASPPRRAAPPTLTAERELARELQARADALADPRLAALAAALGKTLDDVAAGRLTEKEALERLAALASDAQGEAAEAEALRRALARAADALADSAAGSARAAAEALTAPDPRRAQEALEALAAQASGLESAERQALAEALAQAARAARAPAPAGALAPPAPGAAGDQQSGGAEERRRLEKEQRPGESGGAPQSGQAQSPAPDRELKRLQRNLDDAAEDCRRDPQACQESLRRAAQDLARQREETDRSAARQRLADATEQVRERLRREGAEGGAPRSLEDRFERSARGQPGAPTDEAPAGSSPSGTPTPAPSSAPGAPGREGARGLADRAGGSSAEAAAGAGADRAGDQAGGEPLGDRSALAGRGREVAASVAHGEGPSRATVIESSAQRGFIGGAYREVFKEYEAVVEESLDATAVPPGRRYLVRRYFQLIRPR